MLGTNPQQAAEIYRDFYGKRRTCVGSVLQYRLAGIYYRGKDLGMASRCLEKLVDNNASPADLKERALYPYASILGEMGLCGIAREFYERFVIRFPDSAAAAKVRVKPGTT